MNCFATGTVPIYHGSTGIGEFFDTRGIIQFENRKELFEILRHLTFSDYNEMLPYVRENFKRVQAFQIIEDYIAEQYFI